MRKKTLIEMLAALETKRKETRGKFREETDRLMALSIAGTAITNEDNLKLSAFETELESIEAEDKAARTELDGLLKLEETARRNAAAAERQPNNTGGNPHDRSEDQPIKFGQFLQSVRAFAEDNSVYDTRLRKYDVRQSDVRLASGINEGVASEGGFLVGPDVAPGLFQNAMQETEVWSRATNFTIGAPFNGMKFRTVSETSRANGSRWGGVQVYWASEAEAATASKPGFGEVEMSLKKLIGLCYATDEQMQDSSVIESVITQSFTEEFAFKLDDAGIRGTGAGQPLGILTAGCVTTVSKESSQAADTILYANIAKMMARMPARSFKRAVWFVNVDCQPQIQQLVIPVKNVAGTENVGGLPVYTPPGGASAAPYGTLLGRPVVPIEQCATIGDLGDIILADMGMFYTISKGGMQAASSIHVKFLTDESAFRFIMRVDGQPIWKSAVTPFKGASGATLSPFVILEAR